MGVKVPVLVPPRPACLLVRYPWPINLENLALLLLRDTLDLCPYRGSSLIL